MQLSVRLLILLLRLVSAITVSAVMRHHAEQNSAIVVDSWAVILRLRVRILLLLLSKIVDVLHGALDMAAGLRE
jgi:hypothetical protein